VRTFSLVIVISILALSLAAQTQAPQTSPYPDSAEGFRQQLEDLISSYKSGDQIAFRAELDALSIPNANDWITNHFSPADAANLQHDYPLSLAGFLRHLTWVTENAAHLPGWEMVVKPSELPNPPAPSGPEAGIPVLSQPTAVENFRYGPAHPEDPPDRSWVNSFVYLEGRFRYVGGTYPFWAEGLQRLRRPESIPGNFHQARLIHRVSPNYPKEARKKHIEGLVRLQVLIDKKGKTRVLKTISGDALLTEAATKAVQKWRYEPNFLNGQPIEVTTTIDVTFQLNH
jgi:TonB family protein